VTRATRPVKLPGDTVGSCSDTGYGALAIRALALRAGAPGALPQDEIKNAANPALWTYGRRLGSVTFTERCGKYWWAMRDYKLSIDGDRRGRSRRRRTRYHLCYGSPADGQPKDSGLMVEVANAISARVRRPIHYFHLPVSKNRTDDAYFAPLAGLTLGPVTQLYLGLFHYDDAAGDVARLSAARCYARVDGIATECGMARGGPARLPTLLAAHATVANLS
jgi:hypothetical protein